MARKHKHPEHVNLERYLISYADFITLLFATFVVLYALSQVDIKDFKALEESIQSAFSAPSIMSGEQGIMQESSDKLFDTSQADSMITPLMMEYISQKYEEQSFQEIEKNIEDMAKSGELEGVDVTKTDKGLIIKFDDDYLFKSGSAVLIPEAKTKLDKIGVIIAKKFVLHNIRVEGYTDNQPISSSIYPSNWELSSARASSIIRYYISRFNFLPSLFTAVGYAETRPVAANDTPANRAKNRRVELFILKNRFNSLENPTNEITKMNKKAQEELQNNRIKAINQIDSVSEVGKKLSNKSGTQTINPAVLNQTYEQELKRLSKETNALDSETRNKVTGQGVWLKPPAKSHSSTDNVKVF